MDEVYYLWNEWIIIIEETSIKNFGSLIWTTGLGLVLDAFDQGEALLEVD